MKRLLLTLLVLIMLTPSLACADFMDYCPPEQNTSQSQEMPCHKQGKKSPDIKFMKDCAQVDLQGVADHVFFKKQFSQAHDLFVVVVASQFSPATITRNNGIRAPPLDYGLFSLSPVYLSTQRLRI